jgi:hypothetical protein
MKAICIPHHDCSCNYFWNELCGGVAIFTNPQIFHYSEWSMRSCVYEPQSNSQFLTMVTQMKQLFFSFHIMLHKFSIWHIPHPASHMNPDNLSSSAWISIIWGWSQSSTTNVCTWLSTLIQLWPSFLFTPLSFLCHSTSSQRCLLPAAA